PIGGLKEKSMAAYKAGCDTVIIPKDNFKDLAEIGTEVKTAVRFIPVTSFDEVMTQALEYMPKKDRKQNVIIKSDESVSSVVTQ
ncbi:MAG: S16 family serine protease, partial [Eubacterium sp.]